MAQQEQDSNDPIDEAHTSPSPITFTQSEMTSTALVHFPEVTVQSIITKTAGVRMSNSKLACVKSLDKSLGAPPVVIPVTSRDCKSLLILASNSVIFLDMLLDSHIKKPNEVNFRSLSCFTHRRSKDYGECKDSPLSLVYVYRRHKFVYIVAVLEFCRMYTRTREVFSNLKTQEIPFFILSLFVTELVLCNQFQMN